MTLRLKVRTPGGVVTRHDVDRDVVKIGRAANSHVVVADESVSRIHAVAERQSNGTWLLLDLGAGTRLNGNFINRGVIQPGDVIAIGESTLEILHDESQLRPSSSNGSSSSTSARVDASVLHADDVRPLGEHASRLLFQYATRAGASGAILEAVAARRGTETTRTFWSVETEVWWERRLYRLKGAIETGLDNGFYAFGSLSIRQDEVPDRWRYDVERPPEFRSQTSQHRVRFDDEELELVVIFDTERFVATFGDRDFPMSFVPRLGVDANFGGLDSEPEVKRRGAAPYRATAVALEHAEIPREVMQSIRAFVREIDLPGYSDRIHGWKTRVQGGRYLSVRLPAVETRDGNARNIDAIVLVDAGLVYAPGITAET